MPELPDLQVFSRNLTKLLKNKTVASVKVHETKKLNVSKSKLNDALEGQQLKEVTRVGKELQLVFRNDVILALHLMLHGQLRYDEENHDHKHAIIELVFTDDSRLILADYQGQATPTLNPEKRDTPDALEVTQKYLEEHLNKTKAAIKNVLLDQKVIRGIGNAYADEILWDAGISPFSISNKIPKEKVKALTHSIKSVLKDAEKNIIKSKPDIISGEVRDFLLIHNSRKEKSPGGAPILTKTGGGRKTYYTEEQELYQ